MGKSVRRFVGDLPAFVMGAMFLASAPNRGSHTPEILKNSYQYRGEILLFRALAKNMASMTNADESPYVFLTEHFSLSSFYSLVLYSALKIRAYGSKAFQYYGGFRKTKLITRTFFCNAHHTEAFPVQI